MIRGRDREFLPAALEILETPPAPARTAMMLTLCAFVVAGLGWSFFGRLDIHAVAPGKVEVNGRAKVIQPLDPGKVADLIVVKRDPLVDIARMGELSMVIKDGAPIDFGRLPTTPLVTKYPRDADFKR